MSLESHAYTAKPIISVKTSGNDKPPASLRDTERMLAEHRLHTALPEAAPKFQMLEDTASKGEPLKNRLKPKVSIEYAAPHWFIAVRTPSTSWDAVYDTQKPIEVLNAFGDVVRTRHAVMSFPSYDAALNYVRSNMVNCRLVKRSGLFSMVRMLGGFSSQQ